MDTVAREGNLSRSQYILWDHLKRSNFGYLMSSRENQKTHQELIGMQGFVTG